MSDPRHHHFVPQFYLRGFADGVGRKARIYVVDLKRQTSFRTVVRNVAGRRDFNRIEADGADPNALERAYSDLEGAAAQAIRRVEEARSIADPTDRNVILNLIALLAARNPRFRGTMRDSFSDLFKMIAEASVSTRERWEATTASMQRDGYTPEPVPYEELRDFVKEGEYDIEVDQTYLIGLELGAWKISFAASRQENGASRSLRRTAFSSAAIILWS